MRHAATTAGRDCGRNQLRLALGHPSNSGLVCRRQTAAQILTVSPILIRLADCLAAGGIQDSGRFQICIVRFFGAAVLVVRDFVEPRLAFPVKLSILPRIADLAPAGVAVDGGLNGIPDGHARLL